MSGSEVTQLAKRLLSRREAPGGLLFYVSQDWRRQLPFWAVYVALPVILWRLDLSTAAVALACFFTGAKIRDIRWWVAGARQWPTTSELLDWEKIEALAQASSTDQP